MGIIMNLDQFFQYIFQYLSGYFAQNDSQQPNELPFSAVNTMTINSNTGESPYIARQFYMNYNGDNLNNMLQMVIQTMENCPITRGDSSGSDTANTPSNHNWTYRLFRSGQSFFRIELPEGRRSLPRHVDQCLSAVFSQAGYNEQYPSNDPRLQLINDFNTRLFYLTIITSINVLIMFYNLYRANQPTISYPSYLPFRQRLASNTPNFRQQDYNDTQHLYPQIKAVLEPQNSDIDEKIDSLKFIVNHLDEINSSARTYILSQWQEIHLGLTDLVRHYQLETEHTNELDRLSMDYKCPITQQVSPQYFLTSKNTSYDAQAIYRWLQTSSRDPMTNQILEPVLYEQRGRDHELNNAIQYILHRLIEELSHKPRQSNSNNGPGQ